jgi:small-conductance mechanosensitive channel
MPNTVTFTHWSDFTLRNGLHVLGIIAVALILNRLLRLVTNLVIKRAASQTRAAQAREQQTRTLAGLLFSAGTKIVWGIALLTAMPEFGINVTPIATLAGLASLAIGFGAQNLVRDIITGFYIVLEDQYIVGDTIQVAETIGRVEHVTLRRTVVRDARGALVTIANGDIRTVSNLSRDWSQAFVDISLSPDAPLGTNFTFTGDGGCGVAGRSGLVQNISRRTANIGCPEFGSQRYHCAVAGAHAAKSPG